MLPAVCSSKLAFDITKNVFVFDGLKYPVNFFSSLSFLQEMVSVAVQNVQDMQNIVKEPNKNGINGTLHSNGHDPYKHFVRLDFFFLYFTQKCY